VPANFDPTDAMHQEGNKPSRNYGEAGNRSTRTPGENSATLQTPHSAAPRGVSEGRQRLRRVPCDVEDEVAAIFSSWGKRLQSLIRTVVDPEIIRRLLWRRWVGPSSRRWLGRQERTLPAPPVNFAGDRLFSVLRLWETALQPHSPFRKGRASAPNPPGTSEPFVQL